MDHHHFTSQLSRTVIAGTGLSLILVTGCSPVPDGTESPSEETATATQTSEPTQGTEFPTQADCDSIESMQNDDDANAISVDTLVNACDAVVTAVRYDGTIYIQSPGGAEYSGIYVYQPDGAGHIPDTIAVGDTVRVSGELNEYFGARQIAMFDDDSPAFAVVGTGAALPEPVLISDTTTIASACDGSSTGADSRKYEGVRVEVRDVAVTSLDPCGLGYGEREVTGNLIIDDDLHSGDLDELSSVGQSVYSIKGVMHYAYDLYRLYPGPDDIDGEYVEPTPTATPVPSTPTATPADVTVTEPGAATPTAAGTPVAPTPTEIPGTPVTTPPPTPTELGKTPPLMTPTPEPPTPTAAVTPTPEPTPGRTPALRECVSIESMQNRDADDAVPEDTVVEACDAVVTAIRYDGSVYIQNPTGTAYSGIYVYQPGGASYISDDVAVGDLVRVSGQFSEFYGAYQIALHDDKSPSFEVIEQGAGLPAPVMIDDSSTIASNCSGGAAGASARMYEGVRVQVQNVTVTDLDPCSLGYGEREVTGNLLIDDDLYGGDLVELDAVGTVAGSITGVLRYAYDFYRLNPSAGDIVINE